MLRSDRTFARRIAAGLLGLALAWLAGCAQMPMGAPTASVDNLQRARAAGIPPVALGTFQLAPGKSPALDQSVSIRSNTVFSPVGSSFAAYLRESLRVDLVASGLLDPNSPVVISGELIDSQVDAPPTTGTAAVEARFIAIRAGSRIYDKTHRATATWPSMFVGAEAIPLAINQYGSLYRKLVGMLLEDREFGAALRAPP